MNITSGRVALAMSSLALIVAAGGTGYAAAKIGTKDLKNNAVTSAKIKNNAVTGADVKETSLAKVPQAAKADTLNGARIVLVDHRATTGTNQVIAKLNGLTIRVTCAGGTEILSAITSEVDTEISYSSIDPSESDGRPTRGIDDTFDPGDIFTFDHSGTPSDRQYTISWASPNTGSVTAVLTTEDYFDNGQDCIVSGYLVG